MGLERKTYVGGWKHPWKGTQRERPRSARMARARMAPARMARAASFFPFSCLWAVALGGAIESEERQRRHRWGANVDQVFVCVAVGHDTDDMVVKFRYVPLLLALHPQLAIGLVPAQRAHLGRADGCAVTHDAGAEHDAFEGGNLGDDIAWKHLAVAQRHRDLAV